MNIDKMQGRSYHILSAKLPHKSGLIAERPVKIVTLSP